MDRFVIRGGRPLRGEVGIAASKNAALPAMAAAMLTAEAVRLDGVPGYKDVRTMARILRHLGARVDETEASLEIHAADPGNHEAPYDLVRTMRASFFVLGPVLARLGRARVAFPGGCAIGVRPVDEHLKGLAALGATIVVSEGYVEATADRLRGAAIAFGTPSVGATENVMMAACLAEGTTVMSNAAREPEVVDLAELLIRMGARITGAGTGTVTIEGVKALGGATHPTVPDRIEAGTFIVLSVLTGCGIAVRGARRDHLQALESALRQAGVAMDERDGALVVSCEGRWRASDAVTQPYPGFATDLQAQWMVLMALANGSSVVRETVFENRFQHVPELVRLGADIAIRGNTAVIRGVSRLSGAPVMVSDLRAGAALVLAGLAAAGTTEVQRIYHLDRGYDRLIEKLRGVGAEIERVPGPPV
ncbi:MAG: UDP-N-acetylglucosamine 1-carboxyvinyltransferase [Candidatus Coatesbacteria bacterium]